MRTYEAKVDLGSAGVQLVRVQANGYFQALAMLEAMYGKGKIFWGPAAVSDS